MNHDSQRLDGWKSIGAYFGRDRTTAIRWARDRGLPVRAVPGGKTRTVYALRSELDAWARREAPDGLANPKPDIPPLPGHLEQAARLEPIPERSRRRRVTASVLILTAIATVSIVISRPPSIIDSAKLPHDPAVSALYLRGRDEWARRDRPGLSAAIADLREVTRRAPDFAPAYAALADVALLSREYGSTSDEHSFEEADASARHALHLDPELAPAWRALGFLAYWRDHDLSATARALHEALRRDPADPQTQFWIANILADNGEFAAAERHYAAARLTDPGSLTIRIEMAWAHWSASSGDAETDLNAMAREHPDVAVIWECLSMIRIAADDWLGYLIAEEHRARLRAEPNLTMRAQRFRQSLTRGGVTALRSAVLDDALGDRTRPPSDMATVAMIASAAGDRTALIDLLMRAEARHRTWGWAGYRRRLAWRWRADAEITRLLVQRTPPPMAAKIDAT